MIIESPAMIDRLKRGQIALLALCLEKQADPNTSKETYDEYEKEIKENESLIEIFSAKLKSEAHAQSF